MIRDACLSPCGTYRYSLLRQWEALCPLLCVIMLNPSTADAHKDDHTITKLVEFAKRHGFGGFIVVNLYAFRATNPATLRAATDPLGPENDRYIYDALLKTKSVLCAWGSNAAGHPREKAVRELLRMCGIDTYALKVNSDGTPAHPLMLPYTSTLERFAA